MCCAPIELPPVAGISHRRVRPARPVERAAREHLPGPGVVPPGRDAERVVVVVADAEDVAELVRVGALPGALRLGGAAAARVRPDASAPAAHDVHSTYRVSTQFGRLSSGGPNSSVTSSLVGNFIEPNSCQVDDSSWPADRKNTKSNASATSSPTSATHAARASVRMSRSQRVAGRAAGVALELHRVLVRLARHLVRAERGEVHAVAAPGVLHPVLVDGVPVVERAGLVQEVLVVAGHVRARDVVCLRARVAEHRGVLRLGHHERLVRVVGEHERAAELAHRALLGGVDPVRVRRLAVVRPRHVVGVLPVLRVDRGGEARLRDALRVGGLGAGRRGLPRLFLGPLVVLPGVCGGGRGRGGCGCGAGHDPGDERRGREQRRHQQGVAGHRGDASPVIGTAAMPRGGS